MTTRGQSRSLAGIIMLCVMTAACTGGAPQSPATGGSETVGFATASRPPPAARRDSTENAATASLPALPDPEDLIGMTGPRIVGLLGDPVFVRRDPPGEFWRYRSKTCVLELFFYRRGGDWQVDHLEMRRGDKPVTDRPACLAALQQRPRGG